MKKGTVFAGLVAAVALLSGAAALYYRPGAAELPTFGQLIAFKSDGSAAARAPKTTLAKSALAAPAPATPSIIPTVKLAANPPPRVTVVRVPIASSQPPANPPVADDGRIAPIANNSPVVSHFGGFGINGGSSAQSEGDGSSGIGGLAYLGAPAIGATGSNGGSNGAGATGSTSSGGGTSGNNSNGTGNNQSNNTGGGGGPGSNGNGGASNTGGGGTTFSTSGTGGMSSDKGGGGTTFSTSGTGGLSSNTGGGGTTVSSSGTGDNTQPGITPANPSLPMSTSNGGQSVYGLNDCGTTACWQFFDPKETIGYNVQVLPTDGNPDDGFPAKIDAVELPIQDGDVTYEIYFCTSDDTTVCNTDSGHAVNGANASDNQYVFTNPIEDFVLKAVDPSDIDPSQEFIIGLLLSQNTGYADYSTDTNGQSEIEITPIITDPPSGQTDPVPEPASLALFAGALALMGWQVRRRHS